MLSCPNTILQLVDQNSALKKEAGIAERKLLARNERIQNLESLLQDADRRLSIQNQRFEQQLDAVKQRLEQARGTFACSFWVRFTLKGIIAAKASTASPLGFGRIQKPLRGGGGAAPGSIPVPITGGGGSANPLARLQTEESGYVNLVSIPQVSLLMRKNYPFRQSYNSSGELKFSFIM